LAPRKIFVAYRDAPLRRAALAQSPGAPGRYSLFGLDEFAARGARMRHNLEQSPPVWARAASAGLNRIVYASGGYGGDFVSVLASLRTINGADVVFSTVDTVGIPLVLLRQLKLVHTPVIYAGVGLPERVCQLRRLEVFYRRAFAGVRAIVVYAESEASWLRAWLPAGTNVIFVPFGVDVEAFHPRERDPEIDVLSVGADPHRDFQLLLTVARRQPQLTFRIVASREHQRLLGDPPPNVTVEVDVSLETVRDRLAAARVVALPVRANSYSGATTTLLQAMAMAKPVLVSRTDAIATGYELEDGVNVRLVPPADAEAFERALLALLTGADAATALGIRARETVERSLTWERYTNALWDLLSPSAQP
jgi:glycosyltransferase involved in cell wall biosynthesis